MSYSDSQVIYIPSAQRISNLQKQTHNMQLRQAQPQKQSRMRDSLLNRSSSVGGIIHGDPSNNCNHYIDALERFQRDFATVDKQERESKRNLKVKTIQRKRGEMLEREYGIKAREEQNLAKILERQQYSQLMHNMGTKKTAHTESIAVNPITLKYEENPRGRHQEMLDQQNRMNKLIRAHNLVTQGTSGFNIINGRASNHVENMVPVEHHQAFEQKLTQFYSKYKLDPNAHP